VYYPGQGWIPYDAQVFYHFMDTSGYRITIGPDEGDPNPQNHNNILYSVSILHHNIADPVHGGFGVLNYSSPTHSPQLSHVRTIPTPEGALVHADWATALGIEDEDHTGFALGVNAPNPFGPGTQISYTTPSGDTRVLIRVFDIAGRLVSTLLDDEVAAGGHHVVWDGTDDAGHEVASGVYFYRLDTPAFSDERKMVLLK